MMFEFGRGDVVAEIGNQKKYILSNTYRNSDIIDAIVVGSGCVVTGTKAELDKNYIKVGEWDFERNCEIEYEF